MSLSRGTVSVGVNCNRDKYINSLEVTFFKLLTLGTTIGFQSLTLLFTVADRWCSIVMIDLCAFVGKETGKEGSSSPQVLEIERASKSEQNLLFFFLAEQL